MTSKRSTLDALLLFTAVFVCSCGKPALSDKPIGNLDDPNSGAVISKTDKNLTVRGWALAASGIDNIGISVDGKHLLDAQKNVLRQDVQKALPQYENADHAGWNAVVPTTDLALGAHTLQAAIKAKNGSVLDLSTNIQVQP